MSMDCWLDKTKKMTFFGITAHYIEETLTGFKLNDRILCTRDLHTDPKDGLYLREKLREILRSFDLLSLLNKLVFVSDRGTNILKALEPYENINCFAHMMNNAVNQMMKAIQDRLTAIIALVKYFKVTGMNCELETSLKSHVKTRWNSVYYMLDSVIKNWEGVVDILTSKGETHRIDGLDVETLKVS